MTRPFEDHEPHCRRELRSRRFTRDDIRVPEECRCNAPWVTLPARSAAAAPIAASVELINTTSSDGAL